MLIRLDIHLSLSRVLLRRGIFNRGFSPRGSIANQQKTTIDPRVAAPKAVFWENYPSVLDVVGAFAGVLEVEEEFGEF